MPENWLITLSLANDRPSLEEALVTRVAEEKLAIGCDRTVDAMLGYVWLRYIRRDLSLDECLEAAGRLADNYEASVDCETFYAILNKLRIAPNGSELRRNVEANAKSLFASLSEEASSEWAELCCADSTA